MNSYLQRLRKELEDALGSATPIDLTVAPAGKWSAAQILEHLFLTYKYTDRGLRKCLELAAPLAKQATLKDRVATFLVVRLGYFPTGREAPERSVPRGMSPEDARQAIVPELQTMGASLDDCERKFGAR